MTNLSDIFLRTVINGTTTQISLSGVGTTWDGVTSGVWADEHTTPFELAMNQRTGQFWTPTAAQPALLLSGGDLPQVISTSAAPLTETLPIQIRGGNYDNAVYLKHLLQRVLINGRYEAPVTLWVRPYGASNYAVFEVLDGVVQEDAAFINDEANSGFIRTKTTITRQAYAVGDLEEAAFSSSPQTYGNSPLTNPDQLVPFSTTTLTGDTPYTGQPLNLQLVPLSTATVSRLWLATIAGRAAPGASSSTTSSTTSTSGSDAYASTWAASIPMDRPVKPRAFVRVASATANVEVRLIVKTGATSTAAQTTLYTSVWQAPAASTTLMDMGTWPVTIYQRARTSTPYLYFVVQIRSTNGSSASCQVNWAELLWYYEFCRVDASLSVDAYLRIDQYQDVNDGRSTPIQVPPIATIYDRNNFTPTGFADVRGTLPRFRALPAAGGLWCSWIDSGSAHSTTAQITIAATKLPLLSSLRGTP